MENLPEKYKRDIDNATKFSFTAYDFPSLLKVCEALSRDAVVKAGGRIEKNTEGIEEYVIPIQTLVLSPLEQCWEPSKIVGDVNFTPEEMEKITVKQGEDTQ